MRRIVFIGCGGSGNAVIGYLMDRLKAALREVGYSGLPATWQFLVIDARQNPEELPGGLGTVRDHGADYLAVSPAVGAYQVVDSAVSTRPGVLDDLATWAPRDPSSITVPIQDGAGQMRAVGRVLLASQARRVAEALQRSADRTKSDRATADARSLQGVCGPLDGGERPMAIVVTSMAGGSGASMALDVCRLLGGAYNTSNSAMFAFTPDIFDSLPAHTRSGVRPNSLAMLGEIVAMQMGQGAQTDLEFMKHLGLAVGGSDAIPVRRLIPVGRYASDGTPFGDGSTDSIYRALGSALAALVMSSRALDTYVKNVIENNTPTPSLAPGLFGWGSELSSLQWGSLGYASLSMGRDRYAEYSAQRLARATADHLLGGHLVQGEDVPGDVQVQQILTSRMEHVRDGLGLPQVAQTANPSEIERATKAWLSRAAFPQASILAELRHVVNRDVVDHLPQSSGDATNLVAAIRNALRSRRGSLARAAEDIAYREAFSWHEGLVNRIERAGTDALAQHGAVYARAVLDEIGQQLTGAWGAKALRDLGAKQPGGGDAPSDLDTILTRLVGTINDVRSAVIEPVKESYHSHLMRAVYGHLATFAASAFDDIAKGVVEPLRRALTQLIVLWEHETSVGQDMTRGLSVTQTDLYRLWPAESDERVAKRWFTAQNEVLLTDPAIFQDRYQADLVAATVTDGDSGAPTYREARRDTMLRLVTGEWPTTAGEGSPGSPLATIRSLVSNTFKVRPDQPGEVRTPMPAEYVLTLTPGDLLTRCRAYVARPDSSFSTFVRGTIQEYAKSSEGATAVARGFGELLSKAQPLVQVDEHTYSRVHGDEISAAVTYSFSEVPFGGLRLAEELAQIIQDRRTGATTLDHFTRSLTSQDEGQTQISAFGYFPPVVPPVFDNILKPVREQWASAKVTPETRRQFWQLRRARPLTGAIALSEADRLAMVGGWLVGQITGRVKIPTAPYHEPVRVFDQMSSSWVDFPHPLLYGPAEFVRNYEWLAAVLESHLLAVSDFGVGELRGDSMRPYQALRAIWDTSPDQPTNVTSGMYTLGGAHLIGEWVATGEVPPPGSSRCDAPSPEERKESAEAFLGRIAAVAQSEASPVSSTDARGRAAVFRDLADDVLEVIPVIRRMLQTSTASAPLADDVF